MVIGFLNLNEAFEQLLECHKRYDARCWSMESDLFQRSCQCEVDFLVLLMGDFEPVVEVV